MDDFTVVAWPDEFLIVDNSDDWTIYTTTDTQYTLEFESVGLNDAAVAIAARDAALAAQAQADSDVALTHADVVLTHADVVLTHADVVQTGTDKTNTAADRVQTGLDATATAADRVQTGLDAIATAADRVQTGQDRFATAADRVATGNDVASTHADVALTHADVVLTHADVATTNALLAQFAGGTTGQVLIKDSNADYDFDWADPTGMLAAIYDPTNIASDVFNRANHYGTQLAATISNFNVAADARIAAAVGVSVQGYSAVLAGTTASYTVALNTKLNGIAAGADVTVGALPTAVHGAVSKVTPAGADEIGIADSAAAFGLKKVTWDNVLASVRTYMFGVNKVTPVDGDITVIGDSAAGYTPKYSTWGQIKTFLKSYFDGIYGGLAVSNTWTLRQIIVGGGTGNSGMASATGGLGEVEIRGNGVGAAMATFHRVGNFAAYFGIDTDNVWKVGGWSMGAVAYKLWHSGNDGVGSGLNADVLQGFGPSFATGGNTVPLRDAAGDITCRLIRNEYTTTVQGNYFVGMQAIGTGVSNHMIPMTIAQAIAALIPAYGAVGSYVWGFILNTGVSEGGNYAGGSIQPAGAGDNSGVSSDPGNDSMFGNGSAGGNFMKGGGALAGTWSARSRNQFDTGQVRRRLALFVRIL